MKRLIAAVASVVCAVLCRTALGEIECLDYIDATGSQWVDTGIVPYRPTIRVAADFAILEKPAENVAVFGVFRLKDKPDSWEGSPGEVGWSKITSFALFVGSAMNATWTGGTFGQGGYVFSYDASTRQLIEGYLATVYRGGGKAGGGYYDSGSWITTDVRYQYVEGQTFYVGNANNAGEGIYTPEGSMPKTRWYGFKLVDGDETLCDFVPAKDGTKVGFYDTVSGKLLTSQGSDPFIEPEVFVWKGGGTTEAWSDGSNWEGGVAPTNNLVVIPDNCKAVAHTADIDLMNKFGIITLAGENSVLSFSNLTAGVEKTLTAPIRGRGLILIEQAASTADQRNLRISGDNGGFSGDVRAERAGLSVGHRNALGIGGTFTANMTGSQRLELAFSGVMPNDCYLGGGSMVIPAPYCYPELSGTVHVTGVLTLRGYDANGWLILSGNVIRDVSLELSFGDAVDFRIPGLDLSSQSATVWANGGTKKFRGGIKSLGKTAFAEANWICMEENAFDPKFGGSIRLGTNNNSLNFDLNGFDQCYGTMYWMAANKYCPNYVIKSPTPATLTLYGGMYNPASGVTFTDRYCGRVNGAASIELNSTNNATAGSARFAFGASETTGGLICRRGTLTVESTASFSNLTALVVSGEGKMVLNTSDIGNATNLCVAVTNAPANGALTLADGVALSADTMVIKTDRWLDAGVYGGPDSAAPNKLTCLAGTGTITVNRYGGPPGFLLLVR